MPKRKSYIQQSAVIQIIGQPCGYESLSRQARHNVRQNAKIKYDVIMGAMGNQRLAESEALLEASVMVCYYLECEAMARRLARCGAKTKRSGKPCRMKPIEGRKRCKFHGGMSTGPKTLEGQIKALSGLKQYKDQPALLELRISQLKVAFNNSA